MMVALVAIVVILAIGILLFRVFPGITQNGSGDGQGIEINGSVDGTE